MPQFAVSTICFGADADAGIETFGARLQHIHLHHNHGEQDEHLEVGKGTIQFAEFSGFWRNFAT